MDDRDKIILVLALGFVASISLFVGVSLIEFQTYGAAPNVQITEFRVEDLITCDGSLSFLYYLTNTGREGFARVEILSDGTAVIFNNYFVGKGSTRLIVEQLYIDDCRPHVFSAEVARVWT